MLLLLNDISVPCDKPVSLSGRKKKVRAAVKRDTCFKYIVFAMYHFVYLKWEKTTHINIIAQSEICLRFSKQFNGLIYTVI